jgi:hypothetical protein
MSLQVIDAEQYRPGPPGCSTVIATRYVQLGVRILVDPNDPEDMKKVHALQDSQTNMA